MSRIPSASVRKASSPQFSGRSGSKFSKMLSIFGASSTLLACMDFLRERLLMEPSQSFELCSNCLDNFRQCAMSWLTSSLMSHSGRSSISLSSSMFLLMLAVVVSKKTDILARESLIMSALLLLSSMLRKSAYASLALSSQNLWKAAEFLLSMELRRHTARLKIASFSFGSMVSTLRQMVMASSTSPSFLKQMPTLMSELRQRLLVGISPFSVRLIMNSYSGMASSFCPLMRQRLARLQWLMGSLRLMASELMQHRFAQGYLPSARQQQPMLQQA